MLRAASLSAVRAFQDQAFSRNHGLISIDEQDTLARAVVAIPGMGGVGGQHLLSLLRTGFRSFRLADPDTFETVNINRQAGATIKTLGKSKLDVMIEQALAINPHACIESFGNGVTEENLDSFLRGADVVVDSLDFFAFAIRRKLFMRARELNIPVITAGPLGFSAALLVFVPGGMSFDQYFDIREGMSEEECYLRFAMGLAPRGQHFRYIDKTRVSLRRRKGPSSYIACQMCASLASMEAVRLVLGRSGLRPVPGYLQFDPYLSRMTSGRLLWGNRNPLQRVKLALASRFLLHRGDRDGHQEPSRPESRALPLSPEALQYLVGAAVTAPSGDNAQPWKFIVRRSHITMCMVPEADTSFFNVRQLATIISCGAAAENLVLAASTLGLKAIVDAEACNQGQNNELASVQLSENSEPDPLASMIWERCTNRRPYSRRVVSEGLLSRMQGEAEVHGCRLHFVRGEQLKALAKFVFLADRIRTEHQDLHEHFISMLRFSPEEAVSSRDGLPLRNLYAGPGGEAFLKWTKPWSRMRIANKLGFGRIVALHSYQGILHSGAVCLLTVPGFTRRHFFHGGQALQRCWLRLTELGLAMQPMTAITLFRLRWDLEGGGCFSAPHRMMLADLWPKFDSVFPAADFRQEAMIMLFRIGYARPIEFGTYRKSPDSFIQL